MAFRGYYNRVSVLCLLAVAGALPAAEYALAEELELRGTIAGSLIGHGDPKLIDLIDTGAIEDPSYEPVSSADLPARPDSGSMLGSGITVSASEKGATPPSLSTSPLGERTNLRVGTVSDPARRLNQRIQPLQGAKLRRDENPYAPMGIRAGTITLFPTLESGITATTNGTSSPGGDSAVLSETRLELRGNSDWSRHRLEFGGNLDYQNALSGDVEPELRGGADASLRLDINHSLAAIASLGYAAERESLNSPLAVAGVDRQPLKHQLTAALALEKGLGPLRLTVTGQVLRETYDAARLSDGTEISQSDRDSTLALARLRVGYEVSPAFLPFVEVEAGRRIYDEDFDSAGYDRSAKRFGARAGVVTDIAEKLAGEVSIGWISEDFDDSRLRRLSGLALAASLQWSPMRGTNVFLDASTTVEGGSGADSGSILHAAALRVERQLRSNLTGDLRFGAEWRDFNAGGNDLTLRGQASLTWWLNRYAALVARLGHEERSSSDPSREYDATSVYVGMKFQR